MANPYFHSENHLRSKEVLFVVQKGSSIPGLVVAGPDDLRELQPMEARMDVRWQLYANGRVLTAVSSGIERKLTHVQFIPDVAKGLVYIQSAERGAYGAERLDYSGPENGATVSMYVALVKFNLERPKGRVRVFKVEETEPVPGQRFWALNVRTSRTEVARTRKEAESPGEGNGQTAAGDQE